MSDRAVRPSPEGRLLTRVRWRLVAWSAGLTLAVLVLLGAALYVAVERSLATAGVAQLRQRADAITDTLLRFASEPMDPRRVPGAGPVFGGPLSGTLALVVDPSGQAYSGDDTITIVGLPEPRAVRVARQGTEDIRLTSAAGTELRILSRPLEIGGQRYVLQVAQDRTAEQRTLDVLLAVLLAGGLGTAAVSVVLGFLYSGRALVPIRESLRRQREFAADASHELRTPITVIRTNVEHLKRHPDQPVSAVGSAVDDIEAEVGTLTRLVDELLLLARSDSGAVELSLAPTDLADIAYEGMREIAPLAQARSVRMELDAAPAPLVGDAQRLRQLAVILADNAIRHSPPHGTVTFSVASSQGSVTLSVADEGPGIPPEDLERVFDRFWRGRSAPEGGAGLGLAIAAWVVERHNGEIRAANRPSGGAIFSVRLPAQAGGLS